VDETNVDHVEVFQDTDKQWRWRAKAGNDEIVATGESHQRAEDAERAADGVFPGVNIIILEFKEE
jgi:uncharacterized protein YegP (UPF0339 family)